MIDTPTGAEGVWFFKDSFLTQFWYSFFPLKAMFYTFWDYVSMFQCGQYWFCNFMLKFWCFTQEVMGVYHYFKTQFQLNFGILFFFWKRYFMPFRTMFQYVNVASISPAMSFRVFDISLSRRWGSLSLFQNPILTQFGCSFFPLKATIYTFQVHVLMCKCGQYWPCHFTLKFWWFTQQDMGECIIISKPNSYSIWVFFFSPESDNLCLPGPCFNVQMWPVLVLQFHFEVLMFHTGVDGEGISLF